MLKINRKKHPQTAQLLKPKGTSVSLRPLGWGEGSFPTVTETQIRAGGAGMGAGRGRGGKGKRWSAGREVGGGRQVFANTVPVKQSFIPRDISYNGGNGKY